MFPWIGSVPMVLRDIFGGFNYYFVLLTVFFLKDLFNKNPAFLKGSLTHFEVILPLSKLLDIFFYFSMMNKCYVLHL